MKKHNKKRNTAFLYKVLIKEASKALVEKKDDYRKKIVSLVKESFNKNTELGKELYLYKQLTENTEVPARLALGFVGEVNNQHQKVNKKKLFDEQTKLIAKINKNLGSHVFENFVKDYRFLGTVYQMFNVPEEKLSSKVQLQESVAALIVSSKHKEENTLKPIDNITYNIYVNKFNEKYSSGLNESQKKLIKNYIYSVKDNGISFKIYISDEISRLRESVVQALSEEKYREEETIREKLESVVEKIDSFKSSSLDSKMITDVMLMQQLAEELQRND